jgi:lipopolysaccharide export system protein LptA
MFKRFLATSYHLPAINIWLVFVLLYITLPVGNTMAQTRTKVELEAADLLKGDENKYGKGVQALFGNVRFRQANTLLYCDSAYLYRDSNMVIAYSNVHMIHNDSIHLYGGKLDYLGNQNIAHVREHVKMTKGDVVLTTEYLDYDRLNNVGYYYNKGTIVSGDNTMFSNWGFYYPNQNEAFFKDSVKVINPKYTMYSDTMKYHTVREVVSILGPTRILSDSNLIYSERGYYDTKNDLSELTKNSYIKGKEQMLTGDTIRYNRKASFGEVFGQMVLTDTINNVIIKGNYGWFNELTKNALATKRAEMLQVYNKDTLHLHADTLRADTIPEIGARLIRAYHHVKYFRSDIQGRCDSMVYNMKDSINMFIGDPVIWSQGSQMTAQTITMFSKNNKLDKVILQNSAFVVQLDDSSRYNQIKGKTMYGYFVKNELHKIDVDGNGQTIYYPKDKDAALGVNRATSSNLTIYFKTRKIDRIIMRVSPDGNLNPLKLLPEKDVKLDGFLWLEQYRPKSKDDIFRTDVLPKGEKVKTFDDFEDAAVGNLKVKPATGK